MGVVIYIIGIVLSYGRVNAIFVKNTEGIFLSGNEYRMARGQVNLLALFSWITFALFFIDYYSIGKKRGESFLDFKK
jgi:hypothetical protein